jgi:hypothetical protein
MRYHHIEIETWMRFASKNWDVENHLCKNVSGISPDTSATSFTAASNHETARVCTGILRVILKGSHGGV